MKRLVLIGVLFLSGCSPKTLVETNMRVMENTCQEIGGVYQWYLVHGRTVTEFRCLVSLPAVWDSGNKNRSPLPAE